MLCKIRNESQNKKRAMTQKELKEKIHEMYGDLYILDEIDYVNKNTKIKLICKKHGEFYIRPKHLLNGHGCKKCSYEKMGYGLSEFEKKARKVHGDKYIYNSYVNARTPCSITCPIHGEFKQKPSTHLLGSGCPKCAKYRGSNYKQEYFIEEAKKVHGEKYDYSKVEYIDSKTKVCIICPKHGEFWQTPNNHLSGYGCRKCSIKSGHTPQTFIEKAKKVHGDLYDYSLIKQVRLNKKVPIICPKHGIFYQNAGDHLLGGGCPLCNESKLEKEIREYLATLKIKYEREHHFKWLGLQRIDFYLPKYNVAIECQGEQHYKPTSFTNDKRKETERKNFNIVQERDQRKKKLCEENGVKLLYFTHYKDVEEDNIETFKDKEKLINSITI